MPTILNSSGLLVQVNEVTPTVPNGAWGSPSLPAGSVGNIQVSTNLSGQVSNNSGSGRYTLTNVPGIRGSVLATFVVGSTGVTRTIGYLTDNATTPTNRIVLGVDGMNRPYLAIYDYFGALKASVNPSYTSIAAGRQVTAVFSWDSTQAIDSTRFALLQVNRSAIPNGDWATNPVATWTPFQPAALVLGYGIGNDADFNGQIISFQISNQTVAGGTGAGGQFPTSHVFDLFLSDNVTSTTT